MREWTTSHPVIFNGNAFAHLIIRNSSRWLKNEGLKSCSWRRAYDLKLKEYEFCVQEPSPHPPVSTPTDLENAKGPGSVMFLMNFFSFSFFSFLNLPRAPDSWCLSVYNLKFYISSLGCHMSTYAVQDTSLNNL